MSNSNQLIVHPTIDELTGRPISTRSKFGKPVRIIHNRRFEPEYYTWYSMKTRCGNTNHNDYKNWGARGITYDPRWEDFNAFFADMGPIPGKGYCLERKDNNGNYCKDNCIWGLKIHQTRNQRNTKLSMEKAREIRKRYAAGGITMQALADEYGVVENNISAVIRNRIWKE
jgi:hypothetical protein